ncbi:MAG: hypothetical protein U0840_13085 [Gemmataceae bacterium]
MKLRTPVLVLMVGLLGPGWMAAQDALPPVPQGVEVLARGPVHEAFASPTSEPVAPKTVGKKPPAPVEEVPPEEKPEGEVVWINGYWAWDDERQDFLWVSGIWRTLPPGKQWVSGYWREAGGEQWQWVPGFWTAAAKKDEEPKVTYLPAPPAAPEVAAPGQAPAADTFYVPGAWVWTGARYVWRAGYWARMQPGYVWVPDHYRWTPSGYVFVGGYWDLALKRRGILYAPVVIQPEVMVVGFTYTPAYAVRDTVVVESLFVRPAVCHYYFGDYYGPRYTSLGFESCVVYSRRRYDSIIVYESYERRDPAWVGVQINLFNDRYVGRAPRPPRTLIQQNTVVNNTTIVNNNTTIVNNNTTVNNLAMVAPTKQVAATKNANLVKLDEGTRQQARAQAAAVQQVAKQRSSTEVSPPVGSAGVARTAALTVPKAQPVKPGMTAPAMPAARPSATAASLERPTGAKPTVPTTATVGAPANAARNQGSTPTASAGGAGMNPAGRPSGTTAPNNQPGSMIRPTSGTTPAKPGVQPAAQWQPAPGRTPPVPQIRTAPPATKPPQPGMKPAQANPKPAPTRPAPPTRKPPPRDAGEAKKEQR